jgi:hypothetical protein
MKMGVKMDGWVWGLEFWSSIFSAQDGYHHNYMDRNNKCDKIGMDENLHME